MHSVRRIKDIQRDRTSLKFDRQRVAWFKKRKIVVSQKTKIFLIMKCAFVWKEPFHKKIKFRTVLHFETEIWWRVWIFCWIFPFLSRIIIFYIRPNCAFYFYQTEKCFKFEDQFYFVFWITLFSHTRTQRLNHIPSQVSKKNLMTIFHSQLIGAIVFFLGFISTANT